MNCDLRLYREWLDYKPCPGQVLVEELPDCHDDVVLPSSDSTGS